MPSAGTRVLVVDDDPATRESAAKGITSWGYTVEQACDGHEALAKIKTFAPHVLVTDLVMPRCDGFELLLTLKAQGSVLPVIVLSSFGSSDMATRVVHEFGAFWFLEKPVQFSTLRTLLEKAVGLSGLATEKRQPAPQVLPASIVGGSRPMQQVLSQVHRVAPSRIHVFITGESGTGKELIARTIHCLSPRRAGPFMAINCAALPETLVESELFGHEKGAYTGAVEQRQGCFELAECGTLLLDELAEMPLGSQAKLLRVLEDSRVRRIGGNVEITVDVRIIAATNRLVNEMIDKGALREDLFYRLNVFHIHLPPLRERLSDLPELVEAMIRDLSKKHGRDRTGIEDHVMEVFRRYSWPGNIRELRNVLERAVIVAQGRAITEQHLSSEFLKSVERHKPNHQADAETIRLPVGTTVSEAERALVRLTLDHTKNNRARAAEILGISPKTLFTRLKEDLQASSSGSEPERNPSSLTITEKAR